MVLPCLLKTKEAGLASSSCFSVPQGLGHTCWKDHRQRGSPHRFIKAQASFFPCMFTFSDFPMHSPFYCASSWPYVSLFPQGNTELSSPCRHVLSCQVLSLSLFLFRKWCICVSWCSGCFRENSLEHLRKVSGVGAFSFLFTSPWSLWDGVPSWYYHVSFWPFLTLKGPLLCLYYFDLREVEVHFFLN